MARTKTTPSSTESVNESEVAQEPVPEQSQAVINAAEAGSPAGTGEGGPPEAPDVDNTSNLVDAAIDAEPGAGNSTDETALAQATDARSADLQDAQPGPDVAIGDAQLSGSPNPSVVQIYPLRSYMDEGELRRRGGPAYTVPRRHAEDLVQSKLASFEPLEE
ncbi:hypothetical protein [Pseudomonas fluorescens]|uniref:Uncharacterized protein n=1 Tax=Pseudomonas fluorescens TaxID=294 RepID=A0A5E6RDU5_PSEFL|nr:hypothetical protein [Pseudomonas fluorescens]VVM66579.1 hypothetical protein PS652_01556 [Pseudomonas fluorescens]